MRKISIIHATCRGKEAMPAINEWLINAQTQVEYILSVDTEDTYNYENSDCSEYDHFKVIRRSNRSAVDAFNRGVEAARGQILVCISDDMKCFSGWDFKLLEELKDKSDFYMKVQDGIQPTLVTLPIFDREYYNRLGYVWQPDYKHMFCDQEATAVALMLGRYIKSDLVFPHGHYTTGQSKKDAVNVNNDSTWGYGEALFKHRLKNNFGISNPVIPYSAIKWK